MHRLLTIGSLGLAGLVSAGLVTTQLPALAHGGDDDAPTVSRIVRVDDRGRDHPEDGPHHRRDGADDRLARDLLDDHGRHGADDPADHDLLDDHGRHHGVDDRADHDLLDDHGRHHGGDDHGGDDHGGDDHGGHRGKG